MCPSTLSRPSTPSTYSLHLLPPLTPSTFPSAYTPPLTPLLTPPHRFFYKDFDGRVNPSGWNQFNEIKAVVVKVDGSEPSITT